MEVACSLDDVARVLADNGYHFSDDACFPGASDLPSMLGALDSPDSFPESPCSDEDIARVLDITRMSSPSLLDSCARDNFASHLPSPSNSNESYCTGINKTRDPCITNAVLQNSILNVVPGFPNRDSQSLDIFSIALNCSFSDDTPNFNTLVNPKENDFLNNHDNNTYFNSSLALSPVSETGTTLPISSEAFAKHSHHNIADHNFDIQLENNLHHHISFDLPSCHESMCVDNTNNVAIPTTEPQVAPQTKRKRRRKNTHIAPKSKRKKQENPNNCPKPKTNNKLNKKGTSTGPKQKGQTNTPESAAKLKTSHGSKKSQKTTKVNKKNTDSITELFSVNGSKQTIPCDFDIPKDNENEATADIEIGSTNGVTEEPKGLRRSSRSTRNTENYNFRLSSLVKRVETERKQQEPRQPKGKAKPPPLSKYRRRTANARERDRMKEMNDAYENLKNTLPEMEPEDSKQKITKFAILKDALNYISSLQEMLGYDTLPPNLNINIDNEDDKQSAASSNAFCAEINGNHSKCEGNQPLKDNHRVTHSSIPFCTGDNEIVFEQEKSKQESVVL